MTFADLRALCFNSGNLKIRASLYTSAVGTKERKVNPLVQGLLAKERLGYGIKPIEEPSSEDAAFLENGKRVEYLGWTDAQINEYYKENIEEAEKAESNGKSIKTGSGKDDEVQKTSSDKKTHRSKEPGEVEDQS
jgi:hypothetical protein